MMFRSCNRPGRLDRVPGLVGLLVAVLVGGLLAGSGCESASAAVGPDRAFRAIWITRWDYRTRGDVDRAIDDAAGLGFTDVLWQVRGQADAYYRSDLEPWGRELFADLPRTATDPGFDPLARAVARAHERGLRIHAWVNVYPLWRGVVPPADPSHPFNRHPDWRLHDSGGRAQPLREGYVLANPVLVEVRDHIVAVCRDIVERYAVDGLHLDYVRFMPDMIEGKNVWPGDPRTLRLFAEATGRAGGGVGDGAGADREAFRGWIRDQITRLVRRIRREVVDPRPGLELSAAVWRRPEAARDRYLQDAARWLREGTLDRVMPMIYTDDDGQFRSDLAAWISVARDGRGTTSGAISPGIGLYKHRDASQSRRQIRFCSRADGFALFAYSSLFESVNPDQKKGALEVVRRRRLRRALSGVMR